MNTVLENIMTRRSIKKFKSDMVPKESKSDYVHYVK